MKVGLNLDSMTVYLTEIHLINMTVTTPEHTKI
jgi:hypothetical protein